MSLYPIKTKFLEQKQMWSAFVTHQCYDYQEYGETELNAVKFLVERHNQLLPLLYTKGRSVFVMRQIGKNGTPQRTEGMIDRLSSTIIVNGKRTAVVNFTDGDIHCYPIDEIEIKL